ncbi:Beta-galactosidase C-terminal domain [Paenibacillus prosopidis]|uniref:Beta-galactosidase-like protein n=1 Tax=Paenibacillus prosopidis TaxID=630520 RepID=A0A368VPM2_9BACL|nr:Beta-galactosidase C-terminal domain [Paenibacillus prosopidis]RCW43458.1 beta-galactosidase-like protein [Paenibacillus prosopidis]
MTNTNEQVWFITGANQGIGAGAGEGLIHAPSEVELVVRTIQSTGERFIFALNFSSEEVTLELTENFKDLISGKLIVGQVKLEPYGVMVLSMA